MKTLIKKEIRLLLPAWITAMLLAIVPGIFDILWVVNTSKYGGNDAELAPFVRLIFAAGVLFLGINSFGEELSCNTFSALLVQPIKRRRLWVVKIATLAAAFATVWLVAIVLVSWKFDVSISSPWSQMGLPPGRTFLESLKTVDTEFFTLSALVAFSGGLWTTLLLRQAATAFWFTFLSPLAIILGISTALEDRIGSGQSIGTPIAVSLVLYSIAGFFVAWRLFMRAQDVQWTGGEISLPFGERASKANWRRGTHLRSEATGGQAAALPVRTRRSLSALAWKEVQSHQSTLLIAVFVLVLHLTAYFIRKFHPQIENPDLKFVLEAIWILWLLMPLLIGAEAIAEERKTGTLGPQLCLPISRRVQLLIKFCIGLLLSLFFGALIPVLIEGTTRLDQWNSIFVAAAAIFFVSFYASSLARTALQAIGLAILLVLWAIYEYQLVLSANSQHIGFGFIKLYVPLAAAILAIVLGWLTLSNFKDEHQKSKFRAWNFAAILAVSYVLYVLVPKLVLFLLGMNAWMWVDPAAK